MSSNHKGCHKYSQNFIACLLSLFIYLGSTSNLFAYFSFPEVAPGTGFTVISSEIINGDSIKFTGKPKNIGDFNGDGQDDFVIDKYEQVYIDGSPQVEYISYIIPGEVGKRNSSIDLDSFSSAIQLIGYDADRDVFGIGDINQDGFDDLYLNHGHILYGTNNTQLTTFNKSEPDPSYSSKVTYEDDNELNGDTTYIYHAAPTGDINNDGYSDFMLSVGAQVRPGLLIVYSKPNFQSSDLELTTLDGLNGFFIQSRIQRYFSENCCDSSDINGDGYADIIFKDENYEDYENSQNPIGSLIYVLFGRAEPFPFEIDLLSPNTRNTYFDGINGFVVDVSNMANNSNRTLSPIYTMDFNGDGYSDILAFEGIIFGQQDFPAQIDMSQLTDGQGFVFNFAPEVKIRNLLDGYGILGDIDNDGYDDFFTSSRVDDTNYYASIIFGRPTYQNSPVEFDNEQILTVQLSYEDVGTINFDIHSLGDINQDGFSDFAIPDLTSKNDNNAIGTVNIYYGQENRGEGSSPTLSTITTYRSAFKGPTQSAGWNYYWNPTTAIGNAAEYQQLKWTGWNYDNDGISGRNDDQFNYGNLNENGGHPGKGDEQGGVSYDRYVIAAYQVGQDGVYAIQDSFIDHTTSSCSAWSNGDDVRVYVNDDLRLSVPLPKQGSVAFDTALGELAAGDQVYVAIGPNGKDGCDGFSMDYAIALEGDLINTPPVLAPIADQTSDEGISVSFSVSANDAQNDNVTYSAEGLPENVEISATGMISGTPSTAGEYDVTVTATDTNGTYDVASFTWIVGSTGNVIANFYDDFAGENWSYTWNQNSVIGDRSGYVDLAWNGYDFRSGESTYPATSELGYGFIGPRSAHPGDGVNQAVSDRFVIAGYTVDQPGSYQLKEASVEHLVSSCSAWSNGLEVRVYVDDDLIDTFTVAKESLSSINTNLGAVSSGETVFVAVGPNGTAGCDRFSVNFDLVMD